MYTGYATDRILAAESEYAHVHEGLWKLETKEIHEKTQEFRIKFINELTARDGNAEYSEIKSHVFEALDRIYGFSKTDNGIGQQVSNTNNNQQSEVNMCNIKVIVKDGRASVFTPPPSIATLSQPSGTSAAARGTVRTSAGPFRRSLFRKSARS